MEQLATGSALGQAPAPAPAPASAPSRPSQGSSVDVGNSSTKPKQPEKSLLLTEDIPFKRVPSRKSTQGLYAEPYLLSEQEALLYEKPNHAQDVEDIRYRVGDFVAVGGVHAITVRLDAGRCTGIQVDWVDPKRGNTTRALWHTYPESFVLHELANDFPVLEVGRPARPALGR